MLELEDDQLDDMFRALANRGRRAMLHRLSAGPASLTELSDPLDMTLSAVDQHFRILERCGLARSEKHGRVRTCRLEPATLRQAEHWLTQHRRTWERHLDRLGEFLAHTAPDNEETS